ESTPPPDSTRTAAPASLPAPRSSRRPRASPACAAISDAQPALRRPPTLPRSGSIFGPPRRVIGATGRLHHRPDCRFGFAAGAPPEVYARPAPRGRSPADRVAPAEDPPDRLLHHFR